MTERQLFDHRTTVSLHKQTQKHSFLFRRMSNFGAEAERSCFFVSDLRLKTFLTCSCTVNRIYNKILDFDCFYARVIGARSRGCPTTGIQVEQLR